MRTRIFLTLFLTAAIFFPSLASSGDDGSSPRYTVTYFYTTVRCPSCLTIERLTSETIRGEFPLEIEGGILRWRTVNVDEEGNDHYIEDYGLFTKSVIVTETIGGTETRWKNLTRIWELLGSESRFREYVGSEVRNFMERS